MKTHNYTWNVVNSIGKTEQNSRGEIVASNGNAAISEVVELIIDWTASSNSILCWNQHHLASTWKIWPGNILIKSNERFIF